MTFFDRSSCDQAYIENFIFLCDVGSDLNPVVTGAERAMSCMPAGVRLSINEQTAESQARGDELSVIYD